MKFKRHFVRFLTSLGSLALLFMVLCFTPLPWALLRWLQTPPAPAGFTPETIIVLGGGGIPAGSTLARCYAASEVALRHPQARIVIAIPSRNEDPQSPIGLMRHELVLRGVEPSRIQPETQGRNTWEQALAIATLLPPEALHRPALVITSNYHLRRSLGCFRKAGFTQVAGRFATDGVIQADLGSALALRYTFWAAAESLVTSTRELIALSWYGLRGQI